MLLCFIFRSPQGVYNKKPQHLFEVDRRLLTASDSTASDSSHVSFNLSGFKDGTKKRAIFFPNWTTKFPTHEECTHCHESLFLAFRDRDHHPVLACPICGRLFLSNGTAKILTQIRKTFQNKNRECMSYFKRPRESRDVSQPINPTKKNSGEDSNQLGLLQSQHNPLKSNGEKEEVENKKYNSQWQSRSYLLPLQTGSVNLKVKNKNIARKELGFKEPDSSIQNKELELKESEQERPKKYQLRFHIDIVETRRHVLDVLDIVVELYPYICQRSQEGPTLTFQADSFVNKELIKTILEIVGYLCNFNLTYKQLPNYNKLSSRDIKILLTVLHRLGQKWETH